MNFKDFNGNINFKVLIEFETSDLKFFYPEKFFIFALHFTNPYVHN
jgi:hypothetical protein